jgi:hypothetical protein
MDRGVDRTTVVNIGKIKKRHYNELVQTDRYSAPEISHTQ